MSFYQVKDFYTRLKNPDKFAGKRPISLRSSWEIKFAKYLDENPAVEKWGSEDVVIPYFYDLDQKTHRYFMDFYFKLKSGKEYLIEVKPSAQLLPPKKKGKYFKRNMAEYVKNQNKWDATKKLVNKMQQNGRDIEFKIITERELGL